MISASDTFRKAAIEQAVLHGERLGVRVVRQAYGSDPSAVAFDAIAHARSNKIDCVLIDTAGRQETNYNLVKEMEKTAAARALVWARQGRTAFLVDAKRVDRALASLPAKTRVRLIARLRANSL